MAVSKRLRHEVMRRDGHTCRYCGAQAPDVKLTIDHVTPTTLGGGDEPSNLVTACGDCNAGKSATPPDAALVADVDQRAVEWSQAMQAAVAQRTAELDAERGRTEGFDREWRRWNAGDQEVWRDQNWRASVLRLLAAGLTDEFLVDAVGIAMRSKVKPSDTWRYFCGVCWREIDKLQKMAQRHLGATPADSERAMDIPGYGTVTWTEEDERDWDAHNAELRELVAHSAARDYLIDNLLAWTRATPDQSKRIREIRDEVAIEAVRIFNYGVPTPEKISAAHEELERLVAMRLAGEPPVRGRADFDFMAVADEFLDQLVPALGGDEQVRKFVDRWLWHVMPDAHQVWFDAMELPRREDLDDDEEDPTASDAAVAYVRQAIAGPMAEIHRWHESKTIDGGAASAAHGVAAGDACPSTS